jgi:hypothetical protein
MELNMTYEMPIEGSHIIPGFNGVGEINLEDYYKIIPPEIKGGKFSHIGVIDLNEVDEDDDRWLNIGIREEGNTAERIETFENKYEVEGWKTTYVPPLMGTNGDPRDGRGRIIAAKRRNERYVPGFFYVITDDSEKSRVTDGLTENLRHDPAFSATMESVILGCLYIIKNNELELNEVSVRYYLNNDLKIQDHFASHNITKIVNSVLKRGVGGGDPLVVIKERKKWEAWCEKAGVIIDNKRVFLLSADNDTYAYRAWCQHILPAIVKNNDPIEIILFSNNHIPAEARKNVQKFETNLQFFLSASYLMVEKDYAPMLNLPVKDVPYIIKGCIPQVINKKHDAYRKGHRLISIKEY